MKIREENILSMKIRANDIDLIDAERFDSFSSVNIAALIKSFTIPDYNQKLQSSLYDYMATKK